MFEYFPLNVSNQVWYSGAGKVAPAPCRVSVALAGAGAVIVDAAGLPEVASDAAWLGEALAALGDGVAPPLQALAPMATSNPSANRRFVTGVDTGNASSVGAFRAECSVAQCLRPTWPDIGRRGLI